MNPTAIYSKSGKGVQEASGKTSILDRGDRAVLSAIDGRATLADVAQKVGKTFDNAFQTLIGKLDKDGFIREASPGIAPKSAAPAAKGPAGKPAPKPAGKGEDSGADLDFSSLGAPKAAPAPSRPAPPRPAAPPPPKPAAPTPDPAAEARAKEQQSALQRAREEAEAKAQAERDKQRAEAEAKIRAETESKLRAEALTKAKAEAEEKIRAEAEAKAKAVRDAAVKAAAEARAKADAEAKARQEAERKAKEEIERAKKQAEEEARRAREEAERARKAAEEEARKAREEAERARKEAERARKEAEEAARKAREEAERKAKEEAEAMRRQLEEERRRDEEERAARRKAEEEEQAERRKAREEEDRRHEEERAARRKREAQEEEAQPAPEAKKKEEAPAKSAAAGGLDSLMADLDSFTTREEEERKEKEEAERKAREAAAQREREEAERREREEAENRKKEEARARKDEEKRRKREEEEELARKREAEEKRLRDEEEKRKREADERERKAKAEEVLAAKATRGPAVAVGEDTDEVRKRMLGRRGGGAAAPVGGVEAPLLRRRKSGWGKPVAITLVLLLVAAVGAVHVLPVPTADYERAASEALGKPVKIGEASYSLLGGGLQIKLKNIRVGDDARIASGTASPELSALRSEKKRFSRIELDGVQLPQEAIGQALLAKVLGDNFTVERVVVKKLELAGAAILPKPLEVDLVYGIDGALTQATVRGPDTLLGRITPKGNAFEFDVTASGFPLPVLPEVTLSDFRMKGTAGERGMQIAEWGGKIFGGAITGTANVRWSNGWTIDGVVTARNINAAVFAPALLSEGRAEGTGRFSMSGAEPAKLGSGGRLEGTFTIGSGVLGSFDLGRVIRSSGKEYAGRTQFTELAGQGTYDRGAISLRNITIGAGAMNAGASADIAQSGALTGRIVADVKSGTGRAVNATVNLGGTIKEPQVRN